MVKVKVLVVVGLLLAVGMAHGGVSSPQSLINLAQNADLVVVGSATVKLQVGVPVSFSLNVTRVVKGEFIPAGAAITVHWDKDGFGAGLAQPGLAYNATGAGIWFLQRGSTEWSLLPVTVGAASFDSAYFSAPVSPIPAAYAYATTSELGDRIASELSAAIESLNGNFSLQFQDLFRAGFLDELKSPVIQVLYQRLSASPIVRQQILGFSGLIRSGSGSALASAAASSVLFSSYPMENGILLSSISEEFRSSDSASIALLGRAAIGSLTSDLGFRHAAAHALAAIHSGPTLPYLATLLDDPDMDLRVEAVGGVASFANGFPMQTRAGEASLAHLQISANAAYKTPETVENFAMGRATIEPKEASYVSFWKAWWSQNRASLGF